MREFCLMPRRFPGSFRIFAPAVLAAVFAASPREQFRFDILGDRTGEARPGVYERVWREVDADHPAFVINVGDTIQGGNDSTAAAEWKQIKGLIGRYRYPLYLIPGNHDIWSPASEKLFISQSGHNPHYSFDFGTAHFTVLDNSRSDALPDEEMAFLEADLRRNRTRSPKLVFFHRPNPWLMQVLFRNPDFPLHKLAKDYGVTAIVSGHTHEYRCSSLDGVTYLMVGSSGGHLRGDSFEQGWFYQHVRAEVNGSGVTFTVKEADAPFGRSREFPACR